MATQFQVLDPNQPIHQNFLIEASAGTGKTFSIENIVLRLILEDDPLHQRPYLLEELLIVTFTKAATQDLRKRIRTTIESSYNTLCAFLDDLNPPRAVDFLESYRNGGKHKTRKAKHALEHALFCFDRAQIFTVHGFCSRILRDHVLEGNCSLTRGEEAKPCTHAQLAQMIKDYFRTQLTEQILRPSQFYILENSFQKKNSLHESIANKMINILNYGLSIESVKTNEALLTDLRKILKEITDEFNPLPSKIIDDFSLLATQCKEAYDKQGKLKEGILQPVIRFAELFCQNEWTFDHLDLLIEEGVAPITTLSDPKKTAKQIPPDRLHYPGFFERVKEKLVPLAEELRAHEILLLRLANDCKEHIRRTMEAKDLFQFDDFLRQMKRALTNPELIAAIRKKYLVAIVDEFQDTDPLQWDIFQTLFHSDSTRLYLVGDPKQSIYAFRQADIYTYLSARNALGEESQASLTTNYRSHPDLVRALNTLFSSNYTPGLISLPRLSLTLPYLPVDFAEKNQVSPLVEDGIGAVHFLFALLEKKWNLEKGEENYIFPYLVTEIQRLIHTSSLTYKDFAILVADRFQAERVTDYLNKMSIPFTSQKKSHLSETSLPRAFYHLLYAIIHTKQESAIKTALGGPIIGWDHTQILQLEDPSLYESVLAQFQTFRKVLFDKGIGHLFPLLMRSKWGDSSEMLYEIVLKREQGYQYYHDLIQLIEILSEYQASQQASPDHLLLFLDDLEKSNSEEEDVDDIRRTDDSKDAVHIVTGHSSKGLEYGVVFTLGLLKRQKQPEKVFPFHNGTDTLLVAALNEQDERYQAYCREIDAEKMRQLYVSMTRAKYRLYVPVLFPSDQKPLSFGRASPIDLFLAKLGQAETDYPTLYNRISQLTPDHLISLINALSSSVKISYSKLDPTELPPKNFTNEETISLSPPPPFHYCPIKKWMHSFSGLSIKNSHRKEPQEIKPPHHFNSEIKSPHTLPACSETGSLLHLILEKLSFQSVQSLTDLNQLIPLITPFLNGSPFEIWSLPIAEIIWDALKLPLFDNISLSETDTYFREMEFLYPYEGNQTIEQLEISSGYLKGVIDLIVMHENKYYLIDWKSNWLGPNEEAYSESAMEQAMEDNSYRLQASIYKEALRRYLQVFDPRHFDTIYGGTIYRFLRGKHGIYRFK